MGLRANPVLFTLLPALAIAFALHLFLSHEVRLDALWSWLIAINFVGPVLYSTFDSMTRGFFRVIRRIRGTTDPTAMDTRAMGQQPVIAMSESDDSDAPVPAT